MDRRVDAHGHLVRILIGNSFVHVKQVAVARPDLIFAMTADGISKIQVNAKATFPDTLACVTGLLGAAAGNVAWR